MRRPRARLGLLLASSVLVLALAPPPAVAAGPGVIVSLHPPGLILRGHGARLHVLVDGPHASTATGVAYVRGSTQSAFAAIPLGADGSARIPRASLVGRYVDTYVVVHDAAMGRSITVPAGGAKAPDRTWILDDPTRVSLGAHRFGDWRAPQATVATAGRGSGPGQVGIACSGIDGTCVGPSSFDVAADGTLWVVDALHRRLLGWAPGHPAHPSRVVPLAFAPVDIAVAPDGTFYVSQGDGDPYDRVHAIDANGTPRWTHEILTLIYNAHLRIGPGGIPYSVDGADGWVPIADAAGHPLTLAAQQRGMRTYQPLPQGRQLVMATPGEHEWLTGIASPAGTLAQAWRVDTEAPYNVSTEVTPAMVDGDPVIVTIDPDVAHRRLDLMVTCLASGGGVRDHFFIPRGVPKNMLVTTDQRVGPDGTLYVMQLRPTHGIRVVRYSLDGATATPTPTPTPSASPSPSGTPTPVSASASVSPVATPSGSVSPSPASEHAVRSAVPWIAAGATAAAVAGGAVAAVLWRRRRATPS